MLSSRVLRRQPLGLSSFASRKQYFYTANGFRPRVPVKAIEFNKRRESTTTEAGDDSSGHLKTQPNEGILFFDNIFPLKLQWLANIPFFNPDVSIPELMKRVNSPDVALADPSGIVKRALPASLPVKVTEITPRFREGGAYVKFSHESAITSQELEDKISTYLQEKPIRPWFNPTRRVRAFLVQGKPWIEDLYRIPSPRLKVEFLPTAPEANAAELTQEKLFTLFRRYGKIAEIIPQPSDSKITPRFAYLDFSRTRFATMAKNCMHGFIIVPEEGGGKTGTILKLSYEPKLKARWIRDWITSHPRIVIPLLAALLAAASVAVFDPIRTWFIRMHITHGMRIKDWRIVQWVKSQLTQGYDIITFRKKKDTDDALDIVWEDRQSSIEQLKTWLLETADTFIVVQGPRGAGKKELVLDQALKTKPIKIVIDCKKIQEARGDSGTIAAAAAEVGYWPVFGWINSISSMIDLAAMGTIGTKTGFSETLETQLGKIWNNTTTALKKIALSQRKKDDKDAGLDDDDWLEVHPEHRPIIVFENFLHKSNEGSASMVYDKLAEWAARLTTQNIAHVIFLTNDSSFSKSLSKALPDRVFRQILLGDCSPEVAKKVVIRTIDADTDDFPPGEDKLTPSQLRSDLDELDSVIQVLGGRLTDLEFLARRIRQGESPGRAVQQIIEQSASEILKMYLLDVDTAGRKWNCNQAWTLIEELAANETIRYNELLLNDLFKDGEVTLQALEQAELISITSTNGRPSAIKPGKPVYQAAFEYLTQDTALKARFDLGILNALVGIENKNVDKFETELKLIGELPGVPSELKPRIKWLLGKTLTSHAKVEKMERDMGRLKKILAEKY